MDYSSENKSKRVEATTTPSSRSSRGKLTVDVAASGGQGDLGELDAAVLLVGGGAGGGAAGGASHAAAAARVLALLRLVRRALLLQEVVLRSRLQQPQHSVTACSRL